LTDSNRRSETRVTFVRGIKAHILGIDGTWRRGCTMADISEKGARLTFDEPLADLNLKEFFLMLSSNGSVYRRCELRWIDGCNIGTQFVTQTQSAKEKPKIAGATLNAGPTISPQLTDQQVEI
jgi:PilZ domain